MAVAAGMSQVQHAVQTERKATHGEKDDTAIQRAIRGMLGEMGLAKWLGRYWGPPDFVDRDKGDVWGHETRAVDWEGWREHWPKENPKGQRRLWVYRDEPHPERRFVLAMIKMPHVELWGWMIGTAAMRDEWWKDPRKENRWAFYPPHTALRGMDEDYDGWGRVR